MSSQLRPRLTPQEVRFIAKALKRYEDLCTDKQADARISLRELECEPYNPTMRPEDLMERMERKRLLEERQLQYHNERHIASVLTTRFELLLDGRIRHSWNRVRLHLGTKKAQNP